MRNEHIRETMDLEPEKSQPVTYSLRREALSPEEAARKARRRAANKRARRQRVYNARRKK